MVVFGQKWLYSGKTVVFGQNGCIRQKWLYSGSVVVFGQKWLKSGKSGYFRAKVIVLVQKWLYSVKSCFIRETLLYSGKSGCIVEKSL